MNIFNAISAVLHKKDIDDVLKNINDDNVSVYMLQRWVSMYSKHPVNFLNETTNILYNTLDKSDFFKILITNLPKYKFKRISYIKNEESKKTTHKKNEDVVGFIVDENIKKLDDSLKLVFGDD